MAEQTSPAQKTPPPAPKADAKAVEPKAITREIPDGSIDMNLVKPGYGPLEGSPKENDPTQLANPNDPISPVTKPVNPSNPANPPQTQSEKPASEQRMFEVLKNRDKPAATETEAQTKRKAEKAELTKKVGESLSKHNGNESEVPAGDPYWADIARLRSLS